MKNSKKRKICIFSGKRGGFGAYMLLMKLIEADPELELQILLGDMHAAKNFGNTAKEVKNFFPKSKIEIIKMGAGRGDSPLIRTENLSTCLYQAVKILVKLKPDIILVHADRGEHLMVALAALNLGIPIAHTQGGDISGNIDDIQRHAITKLAHLHFPETKRAADRIKKMGEENWRIRVVGSTYIDRIIKKMYAPSAEVRTKYNLGEAENFFIIIFHPDTYLNQEMNYRQMREVLMASKSFGWRSFVLYPCSDPGYEGIIQAIKEIKSEPQFMVFKNIENLDFLGLMAQAKAIIGNSSGSLVEAPYLKLPAINIGNRQAGRDREKNVIDAEPTVKDIKKKIAYVLSDSTFKKGLAHCGYSLGDGRAAEKIVETLKNVAINARLLKKRLAN